MHDRRLQSSLEKRWRGFSADITAGSSISVKDSIATGQIARHNEDVSARVAKAISRLDYLKVHTSMTPASKACMNVSHANTILSLNRPWIIPPASLVWVDWIGHLT